MGGAPHRRRRVLTALVAAFVAAAISLPASRALAADVSPWIADGPQSPSRVETRTFESAAMGRAMSYLIYLPTGYTTGARRYPVLYMLHGMGGSDTEWHGYGLCAAADRLISSGEIDPVIIVMPQGDRGYWMDHAGTDREQWGTYTARDVVAEVDAHFRTIPDRTRRAIGGVSMGAHGALQLAMNHPDTFGVAGGHSLVLRRSDQALPFFGFGADYASRDPMTLVPAHPDVARSLRLWVDIGDKDPWAKLAEQFDGELSGLGIPHDWHEWPGDHSAAYWRAHVADYMRFYDRAFRAGDTRAGLVIAPQLLP